MKTVILIIVLALIVIVGVFYFALRDTTRDVSHQVPYADLLNRPLYTQTESMLAKNLEAFHREEINFITTDTKLFEGVEPLANLALDTKIIFTKAIHYRNGVSGVTHSVLMGKVWVNEKEFPFEYSWGEFHSICLEQPCNYWTFPQAIWQTETDNAKYFME
jgi:hypothetical protein